MERYELGLPKGSIESGEDILAAANREIQEEVGYAARTLTHLTTLTLAPGYSSQHSHLVVARDLYPAPAPGDEPEPLQVVPLPVAQITDFIMQQRISEARSIAALFMVQQLLRAEKQ
jgi:ADP-ribose diphosphatase